MAAKWRRTFTTQRPSFDVQGRPIDFVDVGFEVLDTGDTGIVSVPLPQFTADRVAAEIQARADELLRIDELAP